MFATYLWLSLALGFVEKIALNHNQTVLLFAFRDSDVMAK